jgi:hypothetical protein
MAASGEIARMAAGETSASMATSAAAMPERHRACCHRGRSERNSCRNRKNFLTH